MNQGVGLLGWPLHGLTQAAIRLAQNRETQKIDGMGRVYTRLRES